jgi:hypothetical protein
MVGAVILGRILFGPLQSEHPVLFWLLSAGWPGFVYAILILFWSWAHAIFIIYFAELCLGNSPDGLEEFINSVDMYFAYVILGVSVGK